MISILCAQIYDKDDLQVPYFTFDESDAIERLQPKSPASDFPWGHEDAWTGELSKPQTVSLYLDVVRKCLDADRLDEESIEALQNNGMLPNDLGALTPWSELSWSRWPVPIIPGLEANIIHPDLATHKVFAGRGRLALDALNIDEALSGIDWSGQDNAARRRFFDWLRQTPLRLLSSTWEEIRSYPIWPGPNNSAVSFETYCEPTSQAVARILANYILRAPRTVLRISKVSKSGRGVLGLRTVPSEQEFRSWYLHHTPTQQDRALKKPERSALDRLEQEISTLRRDKKVREVTGLLTAQHRTVDVKGRLRPVADLHIATEAVKGCRLLPEDLVGGRHRRLYQTLGARTKPSSNALERALRRDVRMGELFYRRVDAFVRACDDPERLSDVPCIRLPKRKRLYTPNELALPFNQDYWGTWKKGYSFSDLNPGREDNLIAVGVIDRTPTKETSQAFFEWLSEQKEGVLRRHLLQVIRHFKHGNGPFAWWKYHRLQPCLPVQMNGHRLQLVPFSVAVGKPARIYVPDFREIEEQMLKWDEIRSVVIVEHPRVSGSILNDLKKEGVHSLRSDCSPPIQVNWSGNVSSARRLKEKVQDLTRRPLRHELAKRLEEQDIPGRTLKKAWFRGLEGVHEVRVADTVTPIFKLGHYSYPVDRPWAVNADGSIIWVMDSDDQLMFLYEAIAALIFEEGTPLNSAYALHKAVSMDYRSRFITDKTGRTKKIGQLEEGESDAFTKDDSDNGSTGAMQLQTGRKRVHGATARMAVPSPRRFTRRSQSGYELEPPNVHSKRDSQHGAKGSRRESPQENEEKQALKEKHYAWHCQACLGGHEVSDIAPRPTYGFHLQHRKPIIEAHHVDHLSKGGARGATNLIVLCVYHHQLLGDRISQNQIRAKLHDEAVNVIRRFPIDEVGTSSKPVSGKLITVELDMAPYLVKLFFTGAHAQRWRAD